MNIFAKEKVAREYDAYYVSEQGKQIDELEKQTICQLLKPVKPGHLLEIGCGTGHWTDFFSEMGFQITATDVSDAMMSLAKEKQLSNVTFMEADIRQLPFPDHHLEQIAVVTALEFCGNIKQAFAEMKRILKPGGWLIAGCLNADSTLGKIKDGDPVFKHGEFMTNAELKNHLLTIGEPNILECVHLSPDFKILDKTEQQHTVAGVFMAAAVQKIN